MIVCIRPKKSKSDGQKNMQIIQVKKYQINLGADGLIFHSSLVDYRDKLHRAKSMRLVKLEKTNVTSDNSGCIPLHEKEFKENIKGNGEIQE